MSNIATAERVSTGPGIAEGRWDLDLAHSTIGAVARHMMVTKVRGYFRDFSGSIHVGPTWDETRAEATIATASIDTRQGMRDDHLRSPDFLDVETHPEMTFRSTRIEPRGDRDFLVHGDLTVRGITQPLTLEATFEGTDVNPYGKTVAFVSAHGEFDREAFGMKWNQALESGGVVVGKKFRLELDLQLAQAE